MAGFSTTSGGLNFQFPNRDTVNWDAVMANSFTTISAHNHDRDTAGKGAVLNDRSILLLNAGWFQSQDVATTGTVNLIRANTSDKAEIGADLADLGMINNTYFTIRNNADSADVNAFRLNTSDVFEISPATTFLSTLTVTSAATFTAGLVANGDVDLKTNALKTTTTNGDIKLQPDGTGRTQLGGSGVKVENGTGSIGNFLMTDGTSAADFKTIGYEVVTTVSAAAQSEIVLDISAFSSEFREFALFMTGVGGSVSSYPTVELRTAASGAIGAVYHRVDTAYSQTVGNSIFGSSTNGTGTAKHCFLAVLYNSAPGNITVNIEGWFINTAGNNVPVFGQAGAVVGELVFKNGSGVLNSTGTVQLLGRR
jgi:hypothetical protein